MQRARLAVKQELMEIVPKLKDIAKMFLQLDRGYLKCEATMLNTLAADTEGVPIVKVKVANVSAGERIILDFPHIIKRTLSSYSGVKEDHPI